MAIGGNTNRGGFIPAQNADNTLASCVICSRHESEQQNTPSVHRDITVHKTGCHHYFHRSCLLLDTGVTRIDQRGVTTCPVDGGTIVVIGKNYKES